MRDVGTSGMRRADYALIIALLVLAATGLLTLAVRDTGPARHHPASRVGSASYADADPTLDANNTREAAERAGDLPRSGTAPDRQLE